jgi:hypothetical protein
METQRKDSKGANLPEMEGFLVKKGAVVKSWKKRWCILRDNALAYYTKKVAQTNMKVVSNRFEIPFGID